MAQATPTWRARIRLRHRWLVAALALLAAAVALPMYVMAATDRDENIVLGRNQVIRSLSGERTWQGTFWNHTDSRYTRLDAVVLFLDKDGRPVGQARGAAARLEPGEVFHLQARLRPEAVRMQMYQLRWTTGDVSVALGPWRPWEFGYLQGSKCGELRLKLGSCTPMREIR